ncbi:hypothetical protein Y695_04033 [Hydrogenophaga sp. T4]|nr:hypothetical protein Y695_04033 [Hydrogenophaga sp. T4]
MAFSVRAKWRTRKNSMASTHRASTPHNISTWRTQKNGRWSSSRSRSVPPPNAVRKPTTHTPTASSRLRAPSMMPASAKAAVPVSSTSRRRVSPQN